MKTIDDKNKLTQDVVNNEEKIELNLDVKDFDMSIAEIGDIEEIDNKLVNYIEREVRNSFEYRGYIQYLKEELDLTKCALLPNIDTKITPVSLEFHHFPFTLYDITETVAKSMVQKAKNKTVSCFDVAEEVVLEHFRNNIGLVPLTETLHQMAHNNAIIIPIDKVNGSYKDFIKKYRPFIEQDKIERIVMMESYNGSEDAANFNAGKLKKRIVNYNVDYNRKEDKKEEDDNV